MAQLYVSPEVCRKCLLCTQKCKQHKPAVIVYCAKEDRIPDKAKQKRILDKAAGKAVPPEPRGKPLGLTAEEAIAKLRKLQG